MALAARSNSMKSVTMTLSSILASYFSSLFSLKPMTANPCASQEKIDAHDCRRITRAVIVRRSGYPNASLTRSQMFSSSSESLMWPASRPESVNSNVMLGPWPVPWRINVFIACSLPWIHGDLIAFQVGNHAVTQILGRAARLVKAANTTPSLGPWQTLEHGPLTDAAPTFLRMDVEAVHGPMPIDRPRLR